MTWTPLMRGLLALALLQVILGGGLAIGGVGDERTSVDEREGEPAGEVPGPGTTPVTAPGTPGGGSPPPSEPAPGAVTTEPTFIPPTAADGAGNDRSQAAVLAIHSTYEKLTPEEQANVDRGGADQAIVEGRVTDGRYWRLSAYLSGDEICPEKSHHDPETRSGGSGGGGCSPKSEWGLAASGPGGDFEYLGMHGYAPVEAQQIEFVAKDGRRGRVGGVFRPEMGVSFYVAWLDCSGPDLERIDALSADGAVVSSYNFAEELPGVGWPSWPCDPGGGG